MADSKGKLEIKKGRVLISDPFLLDPNFHRTVVLITEYSELGTMGFVLNQPLHVKLGTPLVSGLPSTTLFQGGPVQLETLHFIHTFGGALEGSIKLMEGLWWGGEYEHLQKLVETDQFDPAQFKFFIGYSGWSGGQLEAEIEDNAWIVGEINPSDAVSNELDSTDLWSRTLKNMGGDYAMMANFPSDPTLN